jgi:plastocyanin
MNRPLTSLGVLMAIVGVFLFYGVFVGFTAGFAAMLLAIILLPIGSGLAFYGAAFRGAYAAQPKVAGGGGGATTGTVWAAIAVAVVAILLAVASLSVAFSAQSNINSVNTQITQANNSIASLNGTLATSGAVPSTVAVKIDWCNLDNTGQDRFCPNEIIVNQGDIVQLMFLHNDSDVHTFTLDTGSYSFQINGSEAGMHDFLSNQNLAGPCSNSGTFAEESAGISGTYCVSGTSLLSSSFLSSHGSSNFKVIQNGNPASAPPDLEEIPVNDMVHVVLFNDTVSEVWGIGAFQATQPGIYEFFCHYHVSNGMFGYLIVLPNPYCNTHASVCGVTSSSG